ncbi:hypothetical protein MC885_015954, partial [Smutsia gigantea]
MKVTNGTQCHYSKGLLLSGSWAAIHVQKIPEQPQKNEDLLLSVQGIPDTFQDFNWYLGEETYGGTRLFTYIPGLPWPQRDGSAMQRRDIVGFPNGSMLLRYAQPSDSGTYQVAVTMNPSWTMRAKTEVQVAEKYKEPSVTHVPMSAAIVAAIITEPLAIGSLVVGSIAYLLVTKCWRCQSHSPTQVPLTDSFTSHIIRLIHYPIKSGNSGVTNLNKLLHLLDVDNLIILVDNDALLEVRFGNTRKMMTSNRAQQTSVAL